MGEGRCTLELKTTKVYEEQGRSPVTKIVTKKCGCTKFYYSSTTNFNGYNGRQQISQGGSTLCGACGYSIRLHMS